jgi:hypothetical protein
MQRWDTTERIYELHDVIPLQVHPLIPKDFNNDGLFDFIIINGTADTISVFIQQSNPTGIHEVTNHPSLLKSFGIKG